MPPGAHGCPGRSPRRRAVSAADRTTEPARAPGRRRSPPAGRMGWYATSSAKPSDSQTGTLRVVEALTVTWVSSWVMTTSRPSGRSELHAPGTRTIRSAPACSPGVSGPSVAAATPTRSSAERPSRRAASASVAGATQTAGLASPTRRRHAPRPCARDARPPRPGPGADGEHERGGRPADDEAGEVPGLRAPGRGRGGDDDIGRPRRVSLEREVEVEGSGCRVEAEKLVGEARLHVPLDLRAACGGHGSGRLAHHDEAQVTGPHRPHALEDGGLAWCARGRTWARPALPASRSRPGGRRRRHVPRAPPSPRASGRRPTPRGRRRPSWSGEAGSGSTPPSRHAVPREPTAHCRRCRHPGPGRPQRTAAVTPGETRLSGCAPRHRVMGPVAGLP